MTFLDYVAGNWPDLVEAALVRVPVAMLTYRAGTTRAALLPVVRNCVIGLREADPAVVESARGVAVGMGPSRLPAWPAAPPWAILFVGMEPSCAGVLGSDAAAVVAETRAPCRTPHPAGTALPPPLSDGLGHRRPVARNAGAQVTRLGGCCGLTGNFGVEKGHYDVSVAVAEQQLLPAVQAAEARTTIVADGYSCRTQLTDLTAARFTETRTGYC